MAPLQVDSSPSLSIRISLLNFIGLDVLCVGGCDHSFGLTRRSAGGCDTRFVLDDG